MEGAAVGGGAAVGEAANGVTWEEVDSDEAAGTDVKRTCTMRMPTTGAHYRVVGERDDDEEEGGDPPVVPTQTSGGQPLPSGHLLEIRFPNTTEWHPLPLPPSSLCALFCGCDSPKDCRHIPLFSMQRRMGERDTPYRFTVVDIRRLLGQSIVLVVLESILRALFMDHV